MKRLALISFAALMVGCGSSGDGDSRIGGADFESHCRAWCEPETGCSDPQMTPVQCLADCLDDAERDPCFGHVVTYQECVLAMECADPFEDCEVPAEVSRPRGAEVPSCETLDNAYARCTCEEYYVAPQQACDEICSLPDECFDQLGVPFQGADCMQTCAAQAEYVGIDCLNAISSTIACLDTCDLDLLTDEQVAACQDEALGISAACD